MGVYDINAGDDLYARLSTLQAGDTVTVHAGTYTTPGFYQVTWAGTADAPIAIMAAPGEHPILQGEPDQNVINITGSYFTLDGFEIRGGSHGLRLQTVDHATISDNQIHDLGDVGISCNFEENCDSLVIRHNEIFDTGHAGTGEGMYLGCNDASCRMTNSIVANNYVHDIGGSQGDGIEIKPSSYGNLVIDNVIVRSNYPGITMYGFTGAHPVNVITRNLVWHAKADNGIQVAGQITVTNNVVIDSAANGIQSKATAGVTTSDVIIAFNTVIGAASGACIKTNDWPGGANEILANNAVYCGGATAIDINGGSGPGAKLTGNIGLGTANGTTLAPGGSLAADFVGAATGNAYPAPGSPLIDVADTVAYTVTEDFNATPRSGALDVGAYEATGATNPGWIPVEGFKDPLPVTGGDTSTVNGGDDPAQPTMSSPGGCCDASGSRPFGSGVLVALVALALRRRS